jgi:hypothetical protein
MIHPAPTLPVHSRQLTVDSQNKLPAVPCLQHETVSCELSTVDWP